MSQVAEPGTRAALPVTRSQLRRAAMGDAAKLASLFSGNGAKVSSEQLSERIEHGGALYFEDDQGPVAVLAWQDAAGGWKLGQPALRADQTGDGHGRWLMTHVEALAIKLNIPRLSLDNVDSADVDWYRRMGYEPQPGKSRTLTKQVGGTWQYRELVPA